MLGIPIERVRAHRRKLRRLPFLVEELVKKSTRCRREFGDELDGWRRGFSHEVPRLVKLGCDGVRERGWHGKEGVEDAEVLIVAEICPGEQKDDEVGDDDGRVDVVESFGSLGHISTAMKW